MKQHNANPNRGSQTSAGVNWTGAIAQSLIRHAARGAPARLAERLEEEWLADMAERKSAMSRLWFACGCCWAMRFIALEHRMVSVAAAAPALVGNAAIAHWPRESRYSRRTATLVMVGGLHAVLVYFLIISLTAHVTTKAPPPPIELARVLPAEPQTDDIRPQIGLIFTTPKVDPTPPVNVTFQTDDPPIDTTTLQPSGNEPPEQIPPPRVPVRSAGGPGAGFPNTDDYYPSAAKFAGEQGATVVQVCVDPKGRLSSAPTTVASSGSARLDAGALSLAKAGSGHYRPTLEDGRPIDSCYPFRIKFELKR